MRVLVAPMMAMAESSGPASRSRVLASAMVSRGWQVTLCIPEGFCVAIPDGVSAQPVRLPTPLGMPRVVGKRMFPLAQRLGLNRRVSMTCFDNVLWLTGNTNERYLETAVRQLRGIIREGRSRPSIPSSTSPRLSPQKSRAFLSSERRAIPRSRPTRATPATANGVNRVLRSLSMGEVRSPGGRAPYAAGALRAIVSCAGTLFG